MVNGHMHAGFRYYEFGFNTRYVNIDSSQASRYYVMIRINSKMIVEIWKVSGAKDRKYNRLGAYPLL